MTGSQLQAALALALAISLHLGAFALRPEPAGASASGAGGRDLITILPAEGGLADLVATWQTPPQAAGPVAPALPDRPAQGESAIRLPAPTAPPDTAPDRPALPRPADAPQSDTLPQRADAPPPPPAPPPQTPPEPAPKPAAAPEPAPKPTAAPGPSVSAQRAAGTGGGAAAGQGGDAPASTLSQGEANDVLAGWGASIRARIEKRKRYPAAADGAEGSVTLRLTIARTGQLAGVSIASSSGNAALDAAALKAVNAAGRFAKAPSGLTEASYSFTLPIRFARAD